MGSLLLDQHFVAGIGNYLRSEILHVSRLSPFDRPKDLPANKKRTLSKDILRITGQAFLTAGVTNDLSRMSILKEQGLSRSKYRFAMQGRDCLATNVVKNRPIGNKWPTVLFLSSVSALSANGLRLPSYVL